MQGHCSLLVMLVNGLNIAETPYFSVIVGERVDAINFTINQAPSYDAVYMQPQVHQL